MSQGVSTINLDLRCASFVMLLPFQPFHHHLDIIRRHVFPTGNRSPAVIYKLPRTISFESLPQSSLGGRTRKRSLANPSWSRNGDCNTCRHRRQCNCSSRADICSYLLGSFL